MIVEWSLKSIVGLIVYVMDFGLKEKRNNKDFEYG